MSKYYIYSMDLKSQPDLDAWLCVYGRYLESFVPTNVRVSKYNRRV